MIATRRAIERRRRRCKCEYELGGDRHCIKCGLPMRKELQAKLDAPRKPKPRTRPVF
jgi:hypothetical protein